MLLFVITTMFSCELVVDVDIPLDKPKLVVNCFYEADSTWKVGVSRNRHILDQDFFILVRLSHQEP